MTSQVSGVFSGEVGVYKRRQPQYTALYRVVERDYERLGLEWEEKFVEDYGFYRKEYTKVLEEYLKCGILEEGCALISCQQCQAAFVVAFSCKRRGVCPSCAMKRSLLFGEHLFKEVLARVPTSHIVWTLPKRFRGYFRSKKSRSKLFVLAWRCVRAAYGNMIEEGMPAMVLTLHTAGGELNYHPHLHGMLPKGVFKRSGEFVELEKLEEEKLSEDFAKRVLRYLKKLDPENVTDEAIAQVLSQEHSGFSVWIGDAVLPEKGLYGEFMARYIARGPVANARIRFRNAKVVYQNKEDKEKLFEPLEFLAALVQHTPYRSERISVIIH